jgi:MmyB-like transcription regulator ligand binding domain
VQRILDRLADTPVAVFTASWDGILANSMWRALFGDPAERSGRDRNLVWRLFMSDRSLIARIPEEHQRFRSTMVSDLHDAAVRYPEDHDLAAMIRDLRTLSASFANLWDNYTVSRQLSGQKTIVSPAVGPVVLDCDILAAIDADLRIVVYTARPGTEDAEKLDQLRHTRPTGPLP